MIVADSIKTLDLSVAELLEQMQDVEGVRVGLVLVEESGPRPTYILQVHFPEDQEAEAMVVGYTFMKDAVELPVSVRLRSSRVPKAPPTVMLVPDIRMQDPPTHLRLVIGHGVHARKIRIRGESFQVGHDQGRAD